MGHRQLLIAFALVALAGSGCTTAIRARVLDAETRQPIEGAVVVGVWTKVEGFFGLYNHRLVGVRETETDAGGWFTLEPMKSSGLDGEGGGQAITVYKFGYVAWSNLFSFPPMELRRDQRVPSNVLLDRFPADASHGRHMSFIDDVRRAGMYGHDLIPKFWDAQAPELRLR